MSCCPAEEGIAAAPTGPRRSPVSVVRYAYAEPSHSSSMRRVFDDEYMLLTTSRMNRAVAPTSMNCAPRALARLPLLSVLHEVPLLLVWMVYPWMRRDDEAVCVMLSSRWLTAR